MVYKNNKKGAQGIGTLIIFIAMILVAAVAAGVLIQTASNLQSKALDVGAQSQQRVTTALEVVSVRGVNEEAAEPYNVLNQTTDRIEIVLRLASGSSPIKLADLEVQFDTKESSDILSFNSSGANFTNKNFGSTLSEAYIEVGDTVTVDFFMTVDITESESMKILLMPKDGTPLPVDVTTPNVMTTKIITLR